MTDTFEKIPLYAREEARMGLINAALGSRRLQASPLARCLAPLLVSLDWLGAPRTLLADLPDAEQPLDIDDLARLLAGQGYRLRQQPVKNRPDLNSLPIASVVLDNDSARVFMGQMDGQYWWHDGNCLHSGAEIGGGSLLLIEADPNYQPLDTPRTGLLNNLMFKARREIAGVALVSLFANLLALLISLFTMLVYNSIIPSNATTTLWGMTSGVIIAIIGAWALRLARLKALSRMTAWAGSRISYRALRKTLGLPIEVSTRLGVDNNLSRLRSIENVRQWFGGAGGAINVDFPFVLIFLLTIALLGGWIVFVPLIGLLLFALCAVPLARLIQTRSNEAGRSSRNLNNMIVVLTARMRALRGVRGSSLWERKLRELLMQSTQANREHALANALSQVIGQTLAMLTVLATMGCGVALVLSQHMSQGGLIATMMLIWRITTPAQQMFTSHVRIRQLLDANRQLDQLLASQGEVCNPQLVSPITSLTANIEADRLYYRHSSDREPSLNGISFAIEPGQLLAVVGPNGAGKSTLLEALAGIRAAQNGRVLVGGHDIRQFDPDDYRAWIGYMPQLAGGLSVKLGEAVRLRCPLASDKEVAEALTLAAGPQWWVHFAAGSAAEALGQTLSPWREDAHAIRMRYIVRLAAALMGNPPLLLLDDPLGDKDPVLDPYLVSLLNSLKGQTTVIIATHRTDLIQRSDQLVVLNDGALVHFGPVNPTPASL
ncbi:ABC-type bacteriocin/lantibiotic exporter with double-glycine peptidase domain [Pseudomonas fluvialis]|uniref:ABC-type bacteriocin/lantibiotic exporter with double-glycine peptidase domain n=1 Tax=Pseudomonas fluvialis TaxID=1793966 RepID=A0A7X0BTM9_9PSED|nr:ATP-binding cassette domain-containing protein [Pseudomonas fluvialis]MBB6342595.1 ABC-type bacteriocin/lantibiotic exporter with double-glycine peptidase domain [Pseudomonas fluvialis]